jgi:SAM-dependent methyltransferase
MLMDDPAEIRESAVLSPPDEKVVAIARLIRDRFGSPGTILVAGCGNGLEAAHLADLLPPARVIGVDLRGAFHPAARDRVELRRADVTQLPFENASFDLVFSFHMLEHVLNATKAIAEMSRVVRPGGGIWIGTPNRERLLAYIGSRDASLLEKVKWNLIDWRARLGGRFTNQLGAHAGFARSELAEMLKASFDVVEDETVQYYSLLYPRHRRVLFALERSGLGRIVYPAIYFAAIFFTGQA